MSSLKEVPFLSLRSVSFSYNGTNRVLDGVSLDVHIGERVAVLGHNGSGKSTLVRILGALQSPLQGAYFISGRDVRDIPLAELRAKVGVVFQNPETQIVAAVVEDDVAFAPENQGLPPQTIQERVDWALERVGMAHKRASPVSTLSGGEKQRVALAGALAAKAECLILDEPTAMLDPEGRIEVAVVLRALHASGTTLVQVTHQLEGLEDADRVLVLSKGNWIWQGGVRDFWPNAERLGFELPPVRRLFAGLRERGISIPTPSPDALASTIEGCLSKKNVSSCAPVSRIFLDVRDLTFRFNGLESADGAVLNGVNALFPEGKWSAIVGRTGSGKSTLVQHLNGLYKLQSGRILLRGKPLPQRGEALYQLRKRVGLVFQMPEDQLFCPTVREELSFAPANAGFDEEHLDRAIRLALDGVGLSDDFLSRNPLALSGGERRLVAIASVLAAEPECLILDEPTAGLDAAYRKKILDLLSELRRSGRTIVTITHDLEMAFECCDRLLVMEAGRSRGEGDMETALPSLMRALSPSVWPEVLQVSSRLYTRFSEIPLTWDVGILLRAIDEILLRGVCIRRCEGCKAN